MDCGIFASKTILLLLSLIFWAAGASLAYVASYVIQSYTSFSHFLGDTNALIPAGIIIGISVVMFIIGLVGCCATLRESKIGLSCFCLIILVVFTAEVAALALSFMYQGRVNSELKRSMSEVFMKYTGDSSAETTAVDFLQTQLQCCGVDSYTNWTSTPWFSTHNTSVPASCCKNTTGCSGQLDQPDLLNTEGCYTKLQALLDGVMSYAMLVVLGFAIIKLFGMMSVCVIACRNGSRRTGYESLHA